MKKMLKSVSVVMLLALALSLVPGHTFAQDVACESDVVVQADENERREKGHEEQRLKQQHDRTSRRRIGARRGRWFPRTR